MQLKGQTRTTGFTNKHIESMLLSSCLLYLLLVYFLVGWFVYLFVFKFVCLLGF